MEPMHKGPLENVYHALLIAKSAKLLKTVRLVVEAKFYLRGFACKSVQKVSTFLMGDVLHVCYHAVNAMVVQITNVVHALNLIFICKIVAFLNALQTTSLT